MSNYCSEVKKFKGLQKRVKSTLSNLTYSLECTLFNDLTGVVTFGKWNEPLYLKYRIHEGGYYYV